MLGERTVNGRFDHDRIEVGRIEGKFSKLTVVVENSDLEMIDFKIEFGDGTNYHPTVSQVFREGTRTQVIELPPGEHTIKFLDFKYKNTPGGGNAKVGVWAWKIGDGARGRRPAPFRRRPRSTRKAGRCSASAPSTATAARITIASTSAATRAGSRR